MVRGRGVLRLQKQLGESDIAGSIVATVPGWTTLLLWVDPDVADPTRVEEAIATAISAGDDQEIEFESRVFTLPTIYGGHHGPDLDLVADVNGLSADAAIERLQATQFAGMVSFSPGMANCMWVDGSKALTAPKYASPRVTTPPGTVGLGGSSISLYSVACPGGVPDGGPDGPSYLSAQPDAGRLCEQSDATAPRRPDRARGHRTG